MYLLQKNFYWYIIKEINNKIVVHGNYVNGKLEIWQRYAYMRIMLKSMYIPNTIKWQKISNGNIY